MTIFKVPYARKMSYLHPFCHLDGNKLDNAEFSVGTNKVRITMQHNPVNDACRDASPSMNESCGTRKTTTDGT